MSARMALRSASALTSSLRFVNEPVVEDRAVLSLADRGRILQCGDSGHNWRKSSGRAPFLLSPV